MTEHQYSAYLTLLETAETLRAMTVNAKASSHQLELSNDVVEAISVATMMLHTAQRALEQR
jgi:hypothetical protein